MDKSFNIEVKCQKCNTKNIYDAKIVYDAEKDFQTTDVVKQIDYIFLEKCKKCGELIFLARPIIYINANKNFALIHVIDNMLENILSVNVENKKDYINKFENIRIVQNYFDFIEKAIIFDNDLNDIVIKKIKEEIYNENIDNDQFNLMFEEVTNNNLAFTVVNIQNGKFVFKEKYEIPFLKYKEIEKIYLTDIEHLNQFELQKKYNYYEKNIMNIFIKIV